MNKADKRGVPFGFTAMPNDPVEFYKLLPYLSRPAALLYTYFLANREAGEKWTRSLSMAKMREDLDLESSVISRAKRELVDGHVVRQKQGVTKKGKVIRGLFKFFLLPQDDVIARLQSQEKADSKKVTTQEDTNETETTTTD